VDALINYETVKTFGSEDRVVADYSRAMDRYVDVSVRANTSLNMLNAAQSLILNAGLAAMTVMAGAAVARGSLRIGDITMAIFLLRGLYQPLGMLGFNYREIRQAFIDMEQMVALRGVAPEITDAADARDLPPAGGHGAAVAFDQVSFQHDARSVGLRDVSFEAPPGTTTALVGPSGAGKSTIIGLLAAFYVPSSGRVLVDGTDLSTVKLSSFRTQLGVVLQETFLFDGTIRENVAFARPEATEEEILAACHIARVDEFAETFENKYDTVVGERGIKLSGGQKQRVSIARAILADPRILILDEATSSLDSESEALIQEGLRYLMRGRTTFVIAHRLSTIRRADQILVVEAGKIIERGNHETLYALGGRYYDLYTKQHAVEANLFLAPGESTLESDEPGTRETTSAGSGRGDASLPDAIRLIRGQGN
jgi:ATP-binding cassette subfamily B protein